MKRKCQCNFSENLFSEDLSEWANVTKSWWVWLYLFQLSFLWLVSNDVFTNCAGRRIPVQLHVAVGNVCDPQLTGRRNRHYREGRDTNKKNNRQTNDENQIDVLNIPAEGKKALVPPTGHPPIRERFTGEIAEQGEDGNSVGCVGTKFLQLDVSNCSFHTHLWKSTTSQMKGMVDLFKGT